MGGTTQSELMSVVIKGLIVDPNCEFLGAAGGRKKERRFQESDGGEEQVAARTKEMSMCRPYIRAKTTFYVYARASLRLRLGRMSSSDITEGLNPLYYVIESSLTLALLLSLVL